MNYKRIYDLIIKNAQNTERFGYTENHHIFPKSLGGTDDNINLVKLTAREHFICHYLLTKIFDKFSPEYYKMNFAFQMMSCNSNYQERYFNNRLYEAAKEGISLAISFSQTGKTNSQFGSMWINDGFESKKIKKGSNIPDGWSKGRVNVHSAETKNNLSLMNKGKIVSEKTKIKLSSIKTGKKHSDESKLKMSLFAKQRKRPHKEETKVKISILQKGKKRGSYKKNI